MSSEGETITIERSRCRALFDGVMIELDGVIVPINDWPKVIALEPSFADWRLLRFPDAGFVVALEPLDVCHARFTQSLLPAPNAR